MLIGIDSNEANQKVRVGSGVYGFELLKQFNKIKYSRLSGIHDAVGAHSSQTASGQNLKFKIYLKEDPANDLPEKTKEWKYRVFGPSNFWTQMVLPLELWREKITAQAPDVFFTPTHYAPRFCPVPSVITIFDLSFIKFPEMFLKKDLYKLKNWTAYSVKQAKKIITISEFSKEEIINYYRVASDKVVVAYPGYDRDKYNIKISAKGRSSFGRKNTLQKYKITGDYLLYIGTIQPRKNLTRLIEAFHKLKVDNKNIKLVLTGMINEGRGGWMTTQVFDKIRQLKLDSEVIVTGYVADENLLLLLGGAFGFVLPSLYEGFGIPVLEALASGIPVVISKSSSLTEVAGKAAIFIEDPLYIDSIYSSLKRLVSLTRNERDELIKLGLTQAEKFSWRESAKKVLDVLMKVGRESK